MLLVIFATRYWIGSSEEELKKYMVDNKIPEPSHEEIKNVFEEFKEVFEKQNA